jgi:hypothetical protein
MYTYMYVCVYIHTYTHICIHVYVYVYYTWGVHSIWKKRNICWKPGRSMGLNLKHPRSTCVCVCMRACVRA